jgi:hypothetical protein
MRGHPEIRLWRKVEKTIDCWYWTGRTNDDGYGILKYLGKPIGAHRLAWILATGCDVPDGVFVCHTCDIPNCVRNDEEGTYVVDGVVYRRIGHLWLGTHAANMADRNNKGRKATGDKVKHAYMVLAESLLRGEDNPMAKLTEDDVRHIRALLKTGLSQAKIARQFGVTQMVVSKISTGKNWGHVK